MSWWSENVTDKWRSFRRNVANFFKKIWEELRKAIAIILVIIAVVLFVVSVFMSGGATLQIATFAFTKYQVLAIAVLALALSFAFHYEAAMEMLGRIFGFVWYVVREITSIAADVVTNVASTLWNGLPTPLKILVFGGGALWIWSKLRRDEPSATAVTINQPAVNRDGLGTTREA